MKRIPHLQGRHLILEMIGIGLILGGTTAVGFVQSKDDPVRLFLLSEKIVTCPFIPGVVGAGGIVLFLRVLLFAASLPWFFIGLRFPSQMVLALGSTVLIAAVLSAYLVPALVGLCRGKSPH